MSNIVELTSSNFKVEVLDASVPVLVDFAAEWCGPCKRLAPIIEEVAKETQGTYKICHLDIDHANDIAAQFDIMSVPTMLFFKKGQVVDKAVGLVSKTAILEKLKAL